MPRQLAALSDVEFEQLISDLLHAETGKRYERFGVGPDGGIDLRYVDQPAAVVEIVQCKHYIRSAFAQLRAAAAKEVPKLEALDPSPTGYRFVTSQSLTPGQKDKLLEALAGWIGDPARIWSAETIEDLLDAHERVEQAHVKLWLSSGAQLTRLLNAGTLNRSNELIARIEQTLPRYVQTQRFGDAQEMLSSEGVCLIAGEPGIGKTTLAQMLLLDCAQQGFEPLYVSEDIAEAWDVLADRPQVFYYDDFLGRIGLSGLRKNEDQRLVDFIERANRHPRRTRLILTTREYILRDAVELHETFERADIEHNRFLLALTDYSRLERGLVLYNHLYHSEAMKPEWLSQLVAERAYLDIIDHGNYNPRLVEFITGLAKPHELAHIGDDWVAFALSALDNPEAIWQRAFEHELDELQRSILIVLVSVGRRIPVADLQTAVAEYCEVAGIHFDEAAFGRSLKVLEITFVGLGALRELPTVDVVNPSVSDYVLGVISGNHYLFARVIDGATYFTQVEQLWNLATTHDVPAVRDDLVHLFDLELERVAEALQRTYESPDFDTLVLGSDGSTGYGTYTHVQEQRLAMILHIVGDAALGDEFRSWALERIDAVRVEWEAGRNPGAAAVELVGALNDSPLGAVAEQVGRTAKTALRDAATDADDFDALDDLWRTAPALFTNEERLEIAGEFTEYAQDALTDYSLDAHELDRIEQVAGHYGVALDEEDLEYAREMTSGADWEPDIDEDRRARTLELDDDSELDDLFGRLGGNDGRDIAGIGPEAGP